jgi:hypothetical protein
MYESSIVKPTKNVKKGRGGRGFRENNRVNLIKVHYMLCGNAQ